MMVGWWIDFCLSGDEGQFLRFRLVLSPHLSHRDSAFLAPALPSTGWFSHMGRRSRGCRWLARASSGASNAMTSVRGGGLRKVRGSESDGFCLEYDGEMRLY